MLTKVLLASGLAALAAAECFEGCHGNGRCTNRKMGFSATSATSQENAVPTDTAVYSTFGYYSVPSTGIDLYEKKDSCTCFTHLGLNSEVVYAWTGPDCSIQTCPHAPAFAGDTLDGNTHNQEVECSGKGICDKGNCVCFPGYEGSACHRTTCPNECSRAGKCMTLKQIAEDVLDASTYYYGAVMATIATYNTAFDAEMSMGCVCDSGRAGADCSIIDCPSTSDPMGGPGAPQGRTCSGRGLCDGSTGECGCFEGFFGTECEKQRNKQA